METQSRVFPSCLVLFIPSKNALLDLRERDTLLLDALGLVRIDVVAVAGGLVGVGADRLLRLAGEE
jgi:hypothetical protein